MDVAAAIAPIFVERIRFGLETLQRRCGHAVQRRRRRDDRLRCALPVEGGERDVPFATVEQPHALDVAGAPLVLVLLEAIGRSPQRRAREAGLPFVGQPLGLGQRLVDKVVEVGALDAAGQFGDVEFDGGADRLHLAVEIEVAARGDAPRHLMHEALGDAARCALLLGESQ